MREKHVQDGVLPEVSKMANPRIIKKHIMQPRPVKRLLFEDFLNKTVAECQSVWEKMNSPCHVKLTRARATTGTCYKAPLERGQAFRT